MTFQYVGPEEDDEWPEEDWDDDEWDDDEDW